MDSALVVGIIAVVVLVIAGGVAYLIGKIKMYRKALAEQMKETMRLGQLNAQAEQERQRNSTDVLVMSIPEHASKPVSPKILEIEQELDTITSTLEFDAHKRPGSDERRELEKRYDELISTLVTHFVHEADHHILTSLSGDSNERTQGEGVQGSKETPLSERKTPGA